MHHPVSEPIGQAVLAFRFLVMLQIEGHIYDTWGARFPQTVVVQEGLCEGARE